MADDKIIPLGPKLEVRDAQRQEFSAHMDRIKAITEIVGAVIQTMRDSGATQKEIVGVLRHAADVLAATDDEG